MNEKDLDKLNVGMDEEVYILSDENGLEKKI